MCDEENLPRDAWRHPRGTDQEYISTIIGWGYPASDTELKVLTPESAEDAAATQLGQDASIDPPRVGSHEQDAVGTDAPETHADVADSFGVDSDDVIEASV
ncbi:hypothetical protein [Amycolatopsis sp. GM8]|uniref:hypothetical protein n=1 Tax=Amycolatopsis sp. GM8 TaxID=2896530 RepID=UPI001F312DA0|nr:hypothetical protein [Amycolatopsis sp. GM8]